MYVYYYFYFEIHFLKKILFNFICNLFSFKNFFRNIFMKRKNVFWFKYSDESSESTYIHVCLTLIFKQFQKLCLKRRRKISNKKNIERNFIFLTLSLSFSCNTNFFLPIPFPTVLETQRVIIDDDN